MSLHLGDTPGDSASPLEEFAPPVLEVDQVTRVYPSPPPVTAVRGVSFTVGRGELVGIVGPSGSGKTTLLHLMGSLDRPTTGSVRVTGLDEAANTPLPKLPQWSSTITGAGMQLVTVWQSKAQLDQIYSRDADNVLTNHRTKLFYPSGLSDMATIEYISNLVGTEHVRSDLDETGWKRAGERLPSRSPSTAVALLTPSVLRQMPVGDALLLHGDLPPAWVRSTGEGTPGRRA